MQFYTIWYYKLNASWISLSVCPLTKASTISLYWMPFSSIAFQPLSQCHPLSVCLYWQPLLCFPILGYHIVIVLFHFPFSLSIWLVYLHFSFLILLVISSKLVYIVCSHFFFLSILQMLNMLCSINLWQIFSLWVCEAVKPHVWPLYVKTGWIHVSNTFFFVVILFFVFHYYL